MSFELPELDRKATQAKVEEHLEKYRLFKYLIFEEREASITAISEIRYHGPTNLTGDKQLPLLFLTLMNRKAESNFVKGQIGL